MFNRFPPEGVTMLRRKEQFRAGTRAVMCAAVSVALLVNGYSIARAAPPDKACSLLTTAEVTTAVGAPTSSQDNQMTMPQSAGASAGETMRMCSWIIPTGALNLAFMKAAQSEDARNAFRARVRQTKEALKAKGWTIEEKQFGTGAACWIGTPPAANRDTPLATGCVGEANGFGISVGTTGNTRIEMEKVKALLDQALGRLA
jgi:hypothetical protein